MGNERDRKYGKKKETGAMENERKRGQRKEPWEMKGREKENMENERKREENETGTINSERERRYENHCVAVPTFFTIASEFVKTQKFLLVISLFSLFNLVFLSFSLHLLPSDYGVVLLFSAYGILQTNFLTSSCIVVAFLVAEDGRNYASTTFGWHYNFHSPRVMFLELQLPHSMR